MSNIVIQNQTRIVVHAIMCGVACFIPIPFLDEWTQQKIGKHMIEGILQSYQKDKDPASTVLSRRYSNWCLGCIVSFFIYPFKKLIRTLAFFLTIKQVVDECEYWLFRGIFIEVAIQAGVDLSDPNVLKSMRALTQKSIDEINSTAIVNGLKGVFEGARKDIVRMARGTFRWVRGQGDWKEIVPKDMVSSIEQLVTPEFKQQIADILHREKDTLKGAEEV